MAYSRECSELHDREKLQKIAKRVDNMRKDLCTSFDAMSNVLMTDLGLWYKVVLCPRSGEGYFGLARRTYSLKCLPDISAVRLNRFTFRFCG